MTVRNLSYELLLAIHSGDDRRPRELLEQGVSADSANSEGSSALMFTLEYGPAELFEELLRRGASERAPRLFRRCRIKGCDLHEIGPDGLIVTHFDVGADRMDSALERARRSFEKYAGAIELLWVSIDQVKRIDPEGRILECSEE